MVSRRGAVLDDLDGLAEGLQRDGGGDLLRLAHVGRVLRRRCCGVWPFGSTTSSEHELRAALAGAQNQDSSSVALRRTTATKRMPG